MNNHDEILKLRDLASNSLRRVGEDFPKPTPYGFIYTATLIAGGSAVTEVFKFNPNTYIEVDMHGILKRLVENARLVQGTLGYVECTEGAVDNLLAPDYIDNNGRKRYNKTWCNGVTVSDNHTIVTIPGTAIRYTVKNPEVKRNTYSDWKTLDESVLVVINAVGEWKDPSIDEDNKNKVHNWLVSTAGDVTKALEYIKNLHALVEKTLSDK